MQRKAAERMLGRVYEVLLRSSAAILHAETAEEMFKEVCRITYHAGGIVAAGVGMIDRDAKRIVPVAIPGPLRHLAKILTVSLDPDVPGGRGPVAVAARRGQPRVCDDFLSNADTAPWHFLAKKLGVHACAALPLRSKEKVVGVFVLYAEKAGIFSPRVRRVLLNIADDMSFALDAFEREKRLRQALQHVREDRKRFSRLFAANPQPMWITSKETRAFLDVNAATLAHYGYSREEFLSMKADDIHVDEDAGRFVREFHLSGEDFRMRGEWRHRKKNGEVIIVNVSTYDMTFLDQQARLVTIAEMTGVYRAEEALRRFRVAMDYSADMIVLIDCATMRFVDVNETSCRLLGYSREELLEMGPQDVLPESRDSLEHDYNEFIANPSNVVGMQSHYRCKNGSLLPFESTRHVLRSGDSNIIVAVSRDMRERLAAREALAQSEEKFRYLVEQKLTGMYIADQERMLYANPGLCEIMGYGEEELAGRNLSELFSEKTRSRMVAGIKMRFERGPRSLAYTFVAKRKDGRLIDIGAHDTLTTYQGRPAVIGVAQDISERKRAEEQIRSYIAELEVAMQGTVDAVSAMVEMRDPYTAGHERRVADLAAAIGAELGLTQDRIQGLRIAGGVHDIGKIVVPAEILSKPSKLTELELEIVKTHAQRGYEVLKNVKFPWPVAEVIRQHHERLDGSGYPRGLKGDEIILEARIMAVADVVESMSSHRPYRPALGVEAACQEIERFRGARFDASVVDVCLKLFRVEHYVMQDHQ
ncbi:MAG: PAS domain S-box protein [Burkholderiales bacterium]